MPRSLANSTMQEHAKTHKAVPATIFTVPAPLRLWHLASFDAPTVAIVWVLSFAWAEEVALPGWVLALVALVTWMVYVADRLLDAYRGFRSGSIEHLRPRHYFHWRYRWILLPAAAVALCAALWIAADWMPASARARNSLLGAAAAAYFFGIHGKHRLPKFLSSLQLKEFLVGVLFTSGCILPAWSRGAASRPDVALWPLDVLFLFFSTLAWLNCHAIEGWESKQAGFQIHFAAKLLVTFGVLLAALLLTVRPRMAALAAAGVVSAFLLAWLDRRRGRLTPLALRVAADLVLLTPVLLAPFAAQIR